MRELRTTAKKVWQQIEKDKKIATSKTRGEDDVDQITLVTEQQNNTRVVPNGMMAALVEQGNTKVGATTRMNTKWKTQKTAKYKCIRGKSCWNSSLLQIDCNDMECHVNNDCAWWKGGKTSLIRCTWKWCRMREEWILGTQHTNQKYGPPFDPSHYQWTELEDHWWKGSVLATEADAGVLYCTYCSPIQAPCPPQMFFGEYSRILRNLDDRWHSFAKTNCTWNMSTCMSKFLNGIAKNDLQPHKNQRYTKKAFSNREKNFLKSRVQRF